MLPSAALTARPSATSLSVAARRRAGAVATSKALSPLVHLARFTAALALSATLIATASAAERWIPTPANTWQVQYEGKIDLTVDADVFMLDLFDTSAKTIAKLKARGKRVVCYLNAGAWENWRPDRHRFPASTLGRNMENWPGERWLDIRRLDALLSLMHARLDLCRRKGFDGVIFDNVNGHENRTGFPLAPANQIAYNAALARAARERGLSPGMNNNTSQARMLEPEFDWLQTESCHAEGWCNQVLPFTHAGKAVVTIEYTDTKIDLERACHDARALRAYTIVKHRKLGAFRRGCSGMPSQLSGR